MALQARKRAAFLHKALGRKLDLNEYEQVGMNSFRLTDCSSGTYCSSGTHRQVGTSPTAGAGAEGL